MKRKKAAPEVRIDISNNFQPVAEGFKRGNLKTLLPGKADIIKMDGVLDQLDGEGRIKALRTIWNALKPGGKAICTVPYYATAQASMNPFSKWPPFSAESFGYFSADVRKRSGYDNPVLRDIDFDLQWSELYPPEWQNRADKTREFGARHYNNVVQGLAVCLTKKGK